MSAIWTDTATVNYAGTDRTFLLSGAAQCTPSTVHRWAVGGPLSGSPESEGTWSRECSRMGPGNRGVHPVHPQYSLFSAYAHAHTPACASKTPRMALDVV